MNKFRFVCVHAKCNESCFRLKINFASDLNLDLIGRDCALVDCMINRNIIRFSFAFWSEQCVKAFDFVYLFLLN